MTITISANQFDGNVADIKLESNGLTAEASIYSPISDDELQEVIDVLKRHIDDFSATHRWRKAGVI